MGVKLTGVAAMLATGKICFFQETEFCYDTIDS